MDTKLPERLEDGLLAELGERYDEKAKRDPFAVAVLDEATRRYNAHDLLFRRWQEYQAVKDAHAALVEEVRFYKDAHFAADGGAKNEGKNAMVSHPHDFTLDYLREQLVKSIVPFIKNDGRASKRLTDLVGTSVSKSMAVANILEAMDEEWRDAWAVAIGEKGAAVFVGAVIMTDKSYPCLLGSINKAWPNVWSANYPVNQKQTSGSV